MDQQQMTGSITELEGVLPGNAFNIFNIKPDQSSDIYAAVLDNDDLLPDDDEIVDADLEIPHKRKYSSVRKIHAHHRAKTTWMKRNQARLQEEQALWLK